MIINDIGFWVPVGSVQPAIYYGKDKTIFSPVNDEESPGLLHRFYISGDTSDIRSWLYFKVIWVNSTGQRTEEGRWLKEWPDPVISKVLKLDNHLSLMERGIGIFFEVAKKIYAIRTEPYFATDDSSYRVNVEAFIPNPDAMALIQEQVIISPTSVDAIAAKVLESLSLLPPSS
jgi:hypothetical protein